MQPVGLDGPPAREPHRPMPRTRRSSADRLRGRPRHGAADPRLRRRPRFQRRLHERSPHQPLRTPDLDSRPRNVIGVAGTDQTPLRRPDVPNQQPPGSRRPEQRPAPQAARHSTLPIDDASAPPRSPERASPPRGRPNMTPAASDHSRGKSGGSAERGVSRLRALRHSTANASAARPWCGSDRPGSRSHRGHRRSRRA